MTRPNPQADPGPPCLCDDPPLDGCPEHDGADCGSGGEFVPHDDDDLDALPWGPMWVGDSGSEP